MYIPIQVPPPTVGDGIVRWGEGGVINRKETQTNFYNIHLMLPRPGQHHLSQLRHSTGDPSPSIFEILLGNYNCKIIMGIREILHSKTAESEFEFDNDIEFPPTKAELKIWPTSFGEQSEHFNCLPKQNHLRRNIAPVYTSF